MEVRREFDENCPRCSGYGVALLLEEWTLARVGDVLINRKPRWARCPLCDPLSHAPLAILACLHEFRGVQGET
jgi:hypothetical protein